MSLIGLIRFYKKFSHIENLLNSGKILICKYDWKLYNLEVKTSLNKLGVMVKKCLICNN